ncbi:hypothetical protein [Mesoflavibacter profundi]|uniref:Cadherin domain-containing protein n=1 Tax=Mesoflavibacter profundi TaxID=2708110 RepID=A0ABT4S379_9FLAO|nr:hypothetical protein [Mesoflavibacter profundi]MDA0178522.1 hypothetical protein [Mesoflavibacter profundi]
MKALHKFLVILLSIIGFNSCSNEENSIKTVESQNIDPSIISIQLIENGSSNDLQQNRILLSTDNISITILENLDISRTDVFIDDNLVESFDEVPTDSFNIPVQDFEDGNHELTIKILSNTSVLASKSIDIKIDNTGPILDLNSIASTIYYCRENAVIYPSVSDEIAGISSVKVYIGPTLISEFNGNDNFVLELDTQLYEGAQELSFEMTDIANNTSNQSVSIDVVSLLVVNIDFPDNFTRPNIDTFHVILSDENGNYLDSETHSDFSEVIKLCTEDLNFTDNTKYKLTFIEEFENAIYNIYVYSDLTKSIVGNSITFQPRPNALSVDTNVMDLPFYQNGYMIKSAGRGYNYVYINDELSGHFSTSYNDNLGSNKAFIQYYNTNDNSDYQWMFVDNPNLISVLNISDFTTSNVVNSSVQINNSNDTPFLSIYGFEDTVSYNDINGHQVFWDASLSGSNNLYNYSYADIFNDNIYSLRVGNYCKEGVGLPPSSISVPNLNVSFNYTGNTINFNGVSGYEVGRARLANQNVKIEFIFDGNSNQITVPTIPDGLITSDITELINNGNLDAVQAVSEDYSDFYSYSDYISNVLVTSNPFYITSSVRERIFINNNSNSIFPIFEFPYFERF